MYGERNETGWQVNSEKNKKKWRVNGERNKMIGECGMKWKIRQVNGERI